MTGYQRAVRWLTARLEGVDDDYRNDVALTIADVTRGASRAQRLAELGALTGLALRLRSRRRTGASAEAVWSDGLRLAGWLLLAAVSTETWALVTDGQAVTVVAAAVATASLACALGALRVPAVVLAALSVVGTLAAEGATDSTTTIATTGLVAAVAVLVGARAPAVAAPRVAGAAGLAAVAGLAVGSAVGAAVGVEALSWGWTVAAPVGVLALGWFDPRFAAAATLLVLARLVQSGFGELGQALAVLSSDGERALLARWLLMGSCVVGAWLATRWSVRRLGRL